MFTRAGRIHRPSWTQVVHSELPGFSHLLLVLPKESEHSPASANPRFQILQANAEIMMDKCGRLLLMEESVSIFPTNNAYGLVLISGYGWGEATACCQGARQLRPLSAGESCSYHICSNSFCGYFACQLGTAFFRHWKPNCLSGQGGNIQQADLSLTSGPTNRGCFSRL